MCYSAEVVADYRQYVKQYGATLSLEEFFHLFWERIQNRSIVIPKAVEAAFADPQTDRERALKALIDQFAGQEERRLSEELFKQRKRLADAERKLAQKETKAALEDQRIAKNKVPWLVGKINDLHRSTLTPQDSRIYPGNYCPVLIMEGGRRVVKPMRYQCRPAGKPAIYDRKYPGTYNARRDNLEGFWRDLFGYSHGVMVANAFYENVPRHKAEGRELRPGEEEENAILEFRPRMAGPMLVACLWSHWKAPGEPELLSFAAITDEPPEEIAATGHDRCIVPLRLENLDEWLQPDRSNLARQCAILDDRERPYYEHRMAA
jgi:putative SOS response-associated peptidase YedK